MQRFWFTWILLIFVMPLGLDAKAFSVDEKSGNNSDGSSRFADPDEQFEQYRLHYGALESQGAHGNSLSLYPANNQVWPGLFPQPCGVQRPCPGRR